MASLFDGNEVVMDHRQGRPIRLRGEFALPAAPHLVDSVKSFLGTHAHELAIPFGLDGLKLVKEVDVPGQRVLRFDHMIDGVPVLGAQLLVATDAHNRVRQVDLYPGATNVIKPTGALLAADQAQDAAIKSLGNPATRMTPPAPRPVWFPTQAGVVRAFEVIVPTSGPAHDWQIIVDAQTGKVLSKRDLKKESPDGSGMVFDPNPVVTANNNSFRDPTATVAACTFAGSAQATIDAQRVSRTLKDLTVTGGNYTLKGPYCDIHNFGAPASTFPAESTGNFNYASNDDRFDAVNVYYHIDTFQRYLQSIGISNAHNSVIQADPHDNNGGAWYSPVDLGLHFSDSGSCRPDRAEDGDCMIHEYQHAIQDNIVPGWASTVNPVTGRDEAGAMGEGAGDFVACCYFADRGSGYQREVFEDWVFGNPPDGGPPTGLRRVDGTKLYPTDWASEVHADGEIWSAALWNIYRAIGGDATGAGAAAAHEDARKAMLRSLFNSYALLATNASMPDGAEALMTTNAANDEYRGKHLREMLQSFHDRGILAVAAGADLYVRDDPADPGTESYHAPAFWDSPDVWIRNADDGGTSHQDPKAGHENWFYARVHNRGSAAARAFVVTFNVKLWLGTEFVYESDFVPYISAVPGFNLAAGGQTIVKAKWPAALVPPAHSHGCVLVSVFTPREHIPAGTHVWDHGNLGQKNVEVQVADAGDSVMVPFRFGNRLSQVANLFRLEVRASSPALKLSILGEPKALRLLASGPVETVTETPYKPSPTVSVLEHTRVEIAHPALPSPVSIHLGPGSRIDLGAQPARRLDASSALLTREVTEIKDSVGALRELAFKPGLVAGVPVRLPPRTDLGLTLRIAVPKDAKSGDVQTVDVVQKNASGHTIGGVRVRVIVR